MMFFVQFVWKLRKQWCIFSLDGHVIVRFAGTQPNPVYTAQMAEKLGSEYIFVKNMQNEHQVPIMNTDSPAILWCSPNLDCFKVNYDDALQKGNVYGGVGVVI